MSDQPDTTIHTLSVPDISCEHCVKAITDEVRPLEGVMDVVVDLGTKTVTVSGGNRQSIVAAIDEAGYEAA